MDFFDQLQDLNRPTVNKKPWMEAVTLTLASASDLDRIADECIAAKIYALDIETTGLDARVFTQPDGSKVTNDKIVGICIAPNEKQSYYLPIRHKDDGAAANVPPRLVRDMLLKIQAAGAVTVFHNGKFDQEFLEHDPAGAMGCWDDPAKWEDTILLAYLRDAREKRRGLKHLAKTLLEREMIELDELFPTGTKRFDFSTLDPTWEPTVWYAAADSLNTLALYHKLNPEVSQKDAFGKGQATVYKIEKLCVTATRWMERCRVPMDRNTITKLIKLGQREWFDSLAELYAGIETVLGRDVRPGWFKSMQGQHHRINAPFDPDCMEPSYMEHREQVIKDLGPDPDVKVPKSVPSLTDAKVRETVQFPNTYDVTIPTEIGLLLRELGVEGLTVTEKSGQVKTSKDELNRIVEEMGDDLPFAPKIKRFREVAKGLSSNLFPVYHDLAPENSPDGRLWVGFNATKTDTGRFSTPASESGDFTGQSRWNLHSIPATYDKSKPECVRKMRTSVKANAGKILFAIDYSGVELRIVTNLSGEPKWVDEFFRCSGCDHRFEKGSCPPHFCPSCWSDKIGDLHTLTALAIYGEDAATKSDFKQKRQAAKGLNFAMCYGGGGSAAQRSVGVDKEEGWRIKRQFDKSYRGLAKWWEEQHKTARKQKYVTTAYGRKYPLPDIDHTDGGFRSKAERNSVNGPVQGCLHPDTKITTSNGLVAVRDLYHDGSSFKVWTGQEWANARPLYSGHKIVCVTGFTSGNTIKTSPEHLFLTWRDQTQSPKNMGDVVEWVRQQELKIGDWVATSTEAVDCVAPHYKWDSSEHAQEGHLFSKGMTPHNYKGFTIDGNSEALWEFLGLVYGDGSINESRFDIHVGESKISGGASAKEIATLYANKINEALGVDAHVYEKARPETDTTRKSMWQVKVCNKAFRDFCREVLGVEDQNTYTKRFPAALWRESVKHRAAFLRGYFSTDGHASASGDAVSVRSVNLGLLRDTQTLLRSIGIRSACREKSLRTSVLDRAEYEKLIGFTLPHKATRLAGRKNNPWEHKSDIAPPHLVKWAGETVYASSIYASLSKGQKSAVLRLKAGSGSRFQCAEYLNKVPDAEIPDDLSKLLRYSWEKVTSSQNTGETVEMFDVEVFDDFHAFVADGCVVHNTSADIMKFAMGLIYRECKERGWLDRAKMCVTIHDELVFEIDEDLAEEAVVAINELMTVRTVKNLGWIIPLKNDIEFGDDWTVPFNLVAMTNPRETKPEVWSERWQRVFPKFYAEYLANGGTGEAKAVAEPAAPTSNTPEFVMPISSQSRHVYMIQEHRLTPELAEIVARVVSKCMGRGKDEIVIETDRGMDLLGFSFKASFAEFKIIAGYEGL